jgi:hemerythrin-like domain-containing protein/quercetin dioxygenase-like cupin family protein
MHTVETIKACDSLTIEHRQMERLLEALDQAFYNEHLSSVRCLMRWIEPEMNTHFACEEEALFSAVSPYHPMVLMEVEHEELMALRDSILEVIGSDSLDEPTWSNLKMTGKRFIKEMLDHIGREDAGIFPTCERALSDEEKKTVIAEMAQIRAKAKKAPLPALARPERSFKVLQVKLDSPILRPIFSEKLLDADGLEIKHLTIRAGDSLPSHWSAKQIILVCLQGTALFRASKQEGKLKPGSVIEISPQLNHGILAKTDCHLLLIMR